MAPTTRPGPRGTTSFAQFRALAVDFDGTLAEDGRVDEAVLAAIDEVRAAGLRVVLVTGRILDELRSTWPTVDDHFDAIVAENGGVLAAPDSTGRLAAAVGDDLARALTARGVVARAGAVLVACSGAQEHVVLEEIRRLGLECQLIRNRSELMVLPSGVSKGSGLLHALDELGLSHHNTLAVGDAENDHSLLEVAELGVAVANAVPSIKAQADIVLDLPNGSGIVALLHSDLLTGRERVHPRRWEMTVGHDEDGRAVHLPASQVNLLIAGGTGDGKSYLTGLVCEQLIGMDYSLLVIDPEGDHVGLGRLHGVLVVGGDRHLPPPSALVPLLRPRSATVVLDLSHLDVEGQDAYQRGLPAEIEARRRATGLPHWVVVDEAHRAIGREGPALPVFDPAAKGHCFATWRPADLSADALASIDTVLALGNPSPSDALVDITAAVADLPRASIARLLASSGRHVVIAQRTLPGRAIVCQPQPRTTPHLRHEHKYGLAGLDTGRQFYFRAAPDRLTSVAAANLADLEVELGRCEPSVLAHHCPRNDFSRWIRGVFQDDQLADTVRTAEAGVRPHDPAAVVEAARLELVAALQARRSL